MDSLGEPQVLHREIRITLTLLRHGSPVLCVGRVVAAASQLLQTGYIGGWVGAPV